MNEHIGTYQMHVNNASSALKFFRCLLKFKPILVYISMLYDLRAIPFSKVTQGGGGPENYL